MKKGPLEGGPEVPEELYNRERQAFMLHEEHDGNLTAAHGEMRVA
jgi:hypothetical protein